LLCYNSNLPAYINISNEKTADDTGSYGIPLLKRSVIVADRFYNDFSLLNIWNSNKVFFIIRHKKNLQFKTIKELELPEKKQQHIMKNEQIKLEVTTTKQKDQRKLRRITLH